MTVDRGRTYRNSENKNASISRPSKPQSGAGSEKIVLELQAPLFTRTFNK